MQKRNFLGAVLVLIALVFLFGCLVQAPSQPGAKAQLLHLLSNAQDSSWTVDWKSVKGEFYGAHSAYSRLEYMDRQNYAFYGINIGNGGSFHESIIGLKNGSLFSCTRYGERWDCGDSSSIFLYSTSMDRFLPNPAEVAIIPDSKVSYLGEDAVNGINVSCYSADTSEIVMKNQDFRFNPKLPLPNDLASTDYWTIYCFSADGVMLKREERNIIDAQRYGLQIGTYMVEASNYSRIAKMPLELPAASPIITPANNESVAESTGSAGNKSWYSKYCYQTLNYSEYGCWSMHVADKHMVGNWSLRMADIGVGSSCGSEHSAVLDILDKNGTIVDQLSVCEGQVIEYKNQNENVGIRLYLLKAVQGSFLARFAVICERIPNCPE